MKSALLFVVTLVFAFPTHADVYKCIENGKVIYGDQPCADGGGRIYVQPAAPAASVAPSPAENAAELGETTAEPEKEPDKLEKMRKFSEQAEKERRIREADKTISKAQSRIKALEAEQAREMAALERKRKAVSNDLADATEQISIAKKQEAAALKYESRMKNERTKLERLQKERDKLDK